MIGKTKGTRAGAHRRNADATRKGILASARRAFARAGYDGVGVREIAQGAGVTAMLVNRYFGSKERLFAEVVAEAIATPSILTRENIASPTLGRDIAAALVERTGNGAIPLDGFLIMLNSLSNKRAAKIERALIEAHHQKSITAALSGELASQRAALVLSLIAGFQVMRQMIGVSALAEADPKTLVRILRPIFQQLVEGNQTRGTKPSQEI
jgi:AcrR family transcriptional regulator